MTNLFSFNSRCVNLREGKIRDGNIVNHNMKVSSTICELFTDEKRDLLPLSNKLTRVELSDHCLQHLIDD